MHTGASCAKSKRSLSFSLFSLVSMVARFVDGANVGNLRRDQGGPKATCADSGRIWAPPEAALRAASPKGQEAWGAPSPLRREPRVDMHPITS